MPLKTAVFPVAGLGTRFLPATKAMPKEMLTILDKPLIQYSVEEAKSAGIEKFVFVISQGKHALEDHFDAHRPLNDQLQKKGKLKELDLVTSLEIPTGNMIIVRQPYPLGLGHAVLCAKQVVQEDTFAVLLPDDLIKTKDESCLEQMSRAYNPELGNMVAVQSVDQKDVSKYGVIDPLQESGPYIKARDIVEKPKVEEAPSTKAAIGRYILRKEIFNVLASTPTGVGNEIQLTDALKTMVSSHGLSGFEFDGERFDCGSKRGWMAANMAFAKEDPDLRDLF